MNPSKLLKSWLAGAKPSSQRDISAIMDESRSLLVSQLPTTAIHIQNLSEGDLDDILAGGKTGMMERAYALYSKKEGRYVPTGKPLAARPAKPSAPAPRPAPAASKPAVIHRATATATATATKPATAPKPQSVLDSYQSMHAGHEKINYIRAHAVEIQTIAKKSTK